MYSSIIIAELAMGADGSYRPTSLSTNDQLHLVARATTVASLLYSSPAWWSFTSAEERARLERLIARLRRGGYLPQDFQLTLHRITIHNIIVL